MKNLGKRIKAEDVVVNEMKRQHIIPHTHNKITSELRFNVANHFNELYVWEIITSISFYMFGGYSF